MLPDFQPKCDTPINGRSTSATWNPIPQTWPSSLWTRTFAGPRLKPECHSQLCICHPSWAWRLRGSLLRKHSVAPRILQLLSLPQPSTKRNPALRVSLAMAHTAASFIKCLAPTYFLPPAQVGRSHLWIPLAACVADGAPLELQNLFVAHFRGAGRAQRVLGSRVKAFIEPSHHASSVVPSLCCSSFSCGPWLSSVSSSSLVHA